MRNQRPTFAKSANAKQVLHSTVAASNSGKNSTSTTHHVATTAVLWAKKKKEAPPQTRCVKWDQTKANHATLHAGQSLIRPPDQQGGCSGRWLMQARLTGRARPRSHPEAVHEESHRGRSRKFGRGLRQISINTSLQGSPFRGAVAASLSSSSHETAKCFQRPIAAKF